MAGRAELVKHLSGGNPAEDRLRPLAIRDLAGEGAAVLVISSYLPEVFRLADRILVARLGRIVEELDPATATAEEIMFAATY